MNLLNSKYIIVEIIPTAATPKKGEIIQISALKLNGLTLLDRFDYRLDDASLPIPEMLSWISYDKDLFTYRNKSNVILKEFKK